MQVLGAWFRAGSGVCYQLAVLAAARQPSSALSTWQSTTDVIRVVIGAPASKAVSYTSAA